MLEIGRRRRRSWAPKAIDVGAADRAMAWLKFLGALAADREMTARMQHRVDFRIKADHALRRTNVVNHALCLNFSPSVHHRPEVESTLEGIRPMDDFPRAAEPCAQALKLAAVLDEKIAALAEREKIQKKAQVIRL